MRHSVESAIDLSKNTTGATWEQAVTEFAEAHARKLWPDGEEPERSQSKEDIMTGALFGRLLEEERKCSSS